jgi:carboxymethylenebutenolidase
MQEHRLELDTADGPLPLYDVTPAHPARSAVVVLQEAFGVNDHIADVTRRFAAAGYRAVAPGLYHRDGVDGLPYDFAVAQPHMANLHEKGLRLDIEATIEHLAGHGFPLRSVGIVGFCMGGSVVVAAAAEHTFGAAVSFYGRGIVEGRFGFPPLAELAPRLKAPWLGLFGDLDASIPPEEVELLRTQAARATVPTSVVRYSDAGHGFHCDARPANYHAPSAADAWTKTLDWLVRYLQPRP